MKKILLTVAMLLSAAGMQAAPMQYSTSGGGNIAFSGDAARVPAGTISVGHPAYSAIAEPQVVQGTPAAPRFDIQTSGGGKVQVSQPLRFNAPLAR